MIYSTSLPDLNMEETLHVASGHDVPVVRPINHGDDSRAL